MIKIYNDFTDLSKMEEYLKIIENKYEKDFKEFIKKNKKLKENNKYSTSKELSENIKIVKQYLNKFFYISNSKNWQILINKCDELLNIYTSDLSFKLLLLGKYATGKSSLINSIIGYNLNLLETHGKICTKNAFIIKYCEDIESISMFNCNITNKFTDIFITKKDGKIAEGKENVKKKLKN